ncbi:MAG: hypothetical protein ACSLEL_02155 [Candidatus Malihini olakiniferum]
MIRKFDGFLDYLQKNLRPIFVDSCPQQALDLRAKDGTENKIAPLPSTSPTHPNLIQTASQGEA